MKVASSWSKNVFLQKIFEKVRTQRNLVRTQRELVYKHKCALNENALNEVRTRRGFAVLSFHERQRLLSIFLKALCFQTREMPTKDTLLNCTTLKKVHLLF